MLHLIRINQINQMNLHLSRCCFVTFSTGTPRGLAPETFLSCFLKLVALCTTLLPPPQIFTPCTRLQSGLLLFQFQTFSQVSTPRCINGRGQAVQMADVNHMTESDSKSEWITIHITSKWTPHPGCFHAVGSWMQLQGLHRSNGKMTSRWPFKGPVSTIWLDLWFICW